MRPDETTTIYRYPHGYFRGVVKTNVAPSITISGFELNNFIITKDETD